MSGTIEKLHPNGYGFIRHDGRDVFFPAAAVDRSCGTFDTLTLGLAVEFELVKDAQGRAQARRVRVML